MANILSELRATSSSAAVPPLIPAVPPVPVQEQPEAVQAPQVPARQDDAPPAQVPQTKKGGNALLWIILGFLLLAAAGAAAFFVVKGLKSKAAAADTSWLYGQWYGTINGSNYCYAFSPYGECHVTVYKPYEFDYGKDARANLCEEYSYLHGLSPKSGKYSIEEGQVVLDVPGGGIADRLSIMTADGEKALSFDGSTYALLRKVSSVGEAMSVEDLLEMSGKDWDPDESLESLLEKAGLQEDNRSNQSLFAGVLSGNGKTYKIELSLSYPGQGENGCSFSGEYRYAGHTDSISLEGDWMDMNMGREVLLCLFSYKYLERFDLEFDGSDLRSTKTLKGTWSQYPDKESYSLTSNPSKEFDVTLTLVNR